MEEVRLWAAYRRKRGTLNLGMRIEYAGALITSTYVNAHRRKGAPRIPIHDFMPNHHEDETEISLEDAKKKWS
jgi:hypothetical protein